MLFRSQSLLPSGAIDVMRRHVFIDTQQMHPKLIRTSVALLGADHVMAGSDWPIVDDGPICAPLADALLQTGLSDTGQRALASGNSLRLLGLASSTPMTYVMNERPLIAAPSAGMGVVSEYELWR